MDASTEPDIIINGVKLTTAQAMTVRVAIGIFSIDISSGLGEDEIGKSIAAGYQRCLVDIYKAFMKEKT